MNIIGSYRNITFSIIAQPLVLAFSIKIFYPKHFVQIIITLIPTMTDVSTYHRVKPFKLHEYKGKYILACVYMCIYKYVCIIHCTNMLRTYVIYIYIYICTHAYMHT